MSSSGSKFPGRGYSLNAPGSGDNRGVPETNSTNDRRNSGRDRGPRPTVDQRNAERDHDRRYVRRDPAVDGRHAGKDSRTDRPIPRRDPSKQSEGISIEQTAFLGASNVKITGGSINITGPGQPRGYGSTDGLIGRGNGGNDYPRGDGAPPYVRQSMFEHASDVETNGGRFSMAGRCGGADDSSDNDSALQPIRQSIFKDSRDVITDGSVFDIVTGSRSTLPQKRDDSKVGSDPKDTDQKNITQREQGTSKRLSDSYPNKRRRPS